MTTGDSGCGLRQPYGFVHFTVGGDVAAEVTIPDGCVNQVYDDRQSGGFEACFSVTNRATAATVTTTR